MKKNINAKTRTSDHHPPASSAKNITIIPIKGMTCASCVMRIERALLKTPGVQKASVNLATEKATVVHDPLLAPLNLLENSIENTGYTVLRENSTLNTINLKIVGMDNPHCLSTVARGLERLPGIISKELAVTGKARIAYNPAAVSIEKIKKTISSLGYEPLEQDSGKTAVDREKEARKREIQNLKIRTLVSILFSLPLLFMAMIAPFFNIPLPWFIDENMALIELVLATPVIIAGSLFYSRGLKAVFKTRTATMDTLVAVGTGTAYIYSIIISIFIWGGNPDYSAHDLYYEVAALLIAFILLGK